MNKLFRHHLNIRSASAKALSAPKPAYRSEGHYVVSGRFLNQLLELLQRPRRERLKRVYS